MDGLGSLFYAMRLAMRDRTRTARRSLEAAEPIKSTGFVHFMRFVVQKADDRRRPHPWTSGPARTRPIQGPSRALQLLTT